MFPETQNSAFQNNEIVSSNGTKTYLFDFDKGDFVVRDGKLVEKKILELPETLTNVIKCKNPRCITTTEQEINHIFKLTDKSNGVYRCLYCETKAN